MNFRSVYYGNLAFDQGITIGSLEIVTIFVCVEINQRFFLRRIIGLHKCDDFINDNFLFDCIFFESNSRSFCVQKTEANVQFNSAEYFDLDFI